MSLHRESHEAQHGGLMAIGAALIAAIAGVQLTSGEAPGIWLLLIGVALAALLIQASRADTSQRPIRVRSHQRHRATSRW